MSVQGPAAVEETTVFAVEEKAQSRQVAAAARHDRLHRLRPGRARHAGHGRVERRAGLHLADRARRAVRPARTRCSCARSGSAFTPGGRPVRMGEDGVRPPPGAPSRRSSTGSRTRSGSAARSPSSRPRRGTTTSSASAPAAPSATTSSSSSSSGSRSGSRSSRSSAASGSPTSARSCASWCSASSRSRSIVYAIDHGVHGFPVSDLSPTMAVFFALVPLRALQLRGLRAAERRRGGDGRPAARRAARRGPQRHHRRTPVRGPRVRDHHRPAAGGDHRHRRLHRRGQHDLRRLRRRARASCSA